MVNPRTPERLKKLRGTNRADRDKPPAAGERIVAVPEAPDSLSHGARTEWKALAPILVEIGTLCQADLRALTQLCETLSAQVELQAIVAKEGFLIKTGGDGFKANPAQKFLETARTQAMRLYSEFGITPRSRASVSQVPEAAGHEEGGFQTLPRERKIDGKWVRVDSSFGRT